ncbi:MAG: anaerobic ribonucleoside-triphosphate reductase, partial [Thermoproteota archaeon]|nr:anaerobic ribonucleoside-triphosphate reductase [Thermoproteota archaeon]
IVVQTDSLSVQQLNALLDGYRKYANITPMPLLGLSLLGRMTDSLDHITAAVRSGGLISIGNNKVRASNGIKKADVKATSTMSLHLLSINLPRLAYESNKDETYFRAKLALMIKPSLAAMSLRKKIIVDYVKKGIMPALASVSQFMQRSTTSIAVNLTGTRESVYNILGESSSEVLQKVLRTAAEVTAGQGKILGEEEAGIAMVSDDSGSRFATLDSEKYGKVSLMQSQNTTSYSQGMALHGRDILNDGKASIQECLAIDKLLNGGFTTSLDLTNLSPAEMKSAIETAIHELPFLRLSVGFAVCTTCGQRSKEDANICDFCKSPHKVPLHL